MDELANLLETQTTTYIKREVVKPSAIELLRHLTENLVMSGDLEKARQVSPVLSSLALAEIALDK